MYFKSLKNKTMTLLLSLPGGSEWLIIFFALLITIVPAIFYILNLQSTLQAISPENRRMVPANVWLLLIPVFGIIWHFIIVNKMSESIKAESVNNNILITEVKPGYNIGLAMCILSCVSIIPVIGIFASLGGLVCWIMYWVKINTYKNLILEARNNTEMLSI